MNNKHIFQIDNPSVIEKYKNNQNYLAEMDFNCNENNCTIYFSSNDIYFPNDEKTFANKIINNDYYEWYRTRTKNTKKHIFVRDILKQWYISGINSKINTTESLLNLLKQETNGYSVTTIGSSAGGYAACLYGSLLNAEKIISFNGQFNINHLLESSSEEINPLIFRNKDQECRKYFSIIEYVSDNKNIFYFYSSKSPQDQYQESLVKSTKINRIGMNTSHHGIPFPKCNLPIVISSSKNDLQLMSDKIFNPIIFSFKKSGPIKTINFAIELIYKKIRTNHECK